MCVRKKRITAVIFFVRNSFTRLSTYTTGVHGKFQGKIFGSSEAVIAETEAYFVAVVLQKGHRNVREKRWNERIALKGDYVNE